MVSKVGKSLPSGVCVLWDDTQSKREREREKRSCALLNENGPRAVMMMMFAKLFVLPFAVSVGLTNRVFICLVFFSRGRKFG